MKPLKHKHLTTGEMILGYDWQHFKSMYNLSSQRNGVKDFIGDSTRGFNDHKAYFNNKKKQTKQETLTEKNTVPEIKEWLTKKKVPFPNNGTKAVLLQLVKSHS
jgi:hypothetical protein